MKGKLLEGMGRQEGGGGGEGEGDGIDDGGEDAPSPTPAYRAIERAPHRTGELRARRALRDTAT